jgi:hypothetical protein
MHGSGARVQTRAPRGTHGPAATPDHPRSSVSTQVTTCYAAPDSRLQAQPLLAAELVLKAQKNATLPIVA